MSAHDRAQVSQAEAWLAKLIKAKLDAGGDDAYTAQLDYESQPEHQPDQPHYSEDANGRSRF